MVPPLFLQEFVTTLNPVSGILILSQMQYGLQNPYNWYGRWMLSIPHLNERTLQVGAQIIPEIPLHNPYPNPNSNDKGRKSDVAHV